MSKRKNQSVLDSFFKKKSKENSLKDDSTPSCSSVSVQLSGQQTQSAAAPTVEGSSSHVPMQPYTSEHPSTDGPDIPILSKNERDDPMQPVLQTFPMKYGRRFSVGYYKKFPWLEYNITSNDMFCFCCRHFSRQDLRKGEIMGRRTFIDVGFSKFKDISNLCQQHEQSERHQVSSFKWEEFKENLRASEKSSAISRSLDKTHQANIVENRNHITVLLELTSLLGRQGIAFRGHDESDKSANRGNFREALETIGRLVPALSARLSQRYGAYTSPRIVNDLIALFGSSVRENIAECVKNAGCFAVLADETKDQARKEQLAIILRYFDGEKICERSIGCFHMKHLTAEALANFIFDEVAKIGIDWATCIAQCYDGAAVMSGWANGVQAKLSEKVHNMRYIHCHAHRLNLVLVDTLKSIPLICDTLSILQSLQSFISNSNTRHELFLKAQDELDQKRLELERAVDTRWSYWHNVIRKVKLRYEALLTVLTVTTDVQNVANGSAEAEGYKKKMESFNFVLCLFLLEDLLSLCHCLSTQLQSESLDVLNASLLIRTTFESLKELRTDDSYAKMHLKAKEFAEKIGLEVETKKDGPAPSACKGKRVRETSRKLQDFLILSSVGARSSSESPSGFRETSYLPAVDKIVSEFERRFMENMGIFDTIMCFDPKYEGFLDETSIENFVREFPHTVFGDVVESLNLELKMAKVLATKAETCKNVFEFYDLVRKTPESFRGLLKVLRVMLTIPVSTASNERFFSTLKRVKSYIRSTMGDERLMNLMLMASEQEFIKSLKLSELVDKFAKIEKRRYPLY